MLLHHDEINGRVWKAPLCCTETVRTQAASQPPGGTVPTAQGGTHLKSSRISLWLAWKGIFRTRILEVVCFLETCFFREVVKAGLG